MIRELPRFDATSPCVTAANRYAAASGKTPSAWLDAPVKQTRIHRAGVQVVWLHSAMMCCPASAAPVRRPGASRHGTRAGTPEPHDGALVGNPVLPERGMPPNHPCVPGLQARPPPAQRGITWVAASRSMLRNRMRPNPLGSTISADHQHFGGAALAPCTGGGILAIRDGRYVSSTSTSPLSLSARSGPWHVETGAAWSRRSGSSQTQYALQPRALTPVSDWSISKLQPARRSSVRVLSKMVQMSLCLGTGMTAHQAGGWRGTHRQRCRNARRAKLGHRSYSRNAWQASSVANQSAFVQVRGSPCPGLALASGFHPLWRGAAG